MIQSNCRRVLAQRKLAALKLLAKKRKRLLGHLRPLYEALFVLPSGECHIYVTPRLPCE